VQHGWNICRAMVEPGQVIVTENEMPDCALPRCQNPNCTVAELGDGSMALVALRRVKAGEWLTVAESSSDEDDYIITDDSE